MKASFSKYPVDIVLCLLLSILLVPLVLLNIQGLLRIALGLPFILFIPGYVLMFTLFPQKKSKPRIDTFERLALSFGLSLAIVPLLGLLLNYTPWGIRLQPILFSLFLFITSIGVLGIYRWLKLPVEKRFIITITVRFPASDSRLDKALTLILIACIILVSLTLIYVIMTPRIGEQFTEFYLLGPTGIADEYPSTLPVNATAAGYVGLINHEYQTMNYTVEVWLQHEKTVYNASSQDNETVPQHLWFLNKTQVTLNHTPADIDQPWAPQWQQYFSYTIPEKGIGKLMFLLYTNTTEEYTTGQDYVALAEEKLQAAYQELHLWLRVTYTDFYLLDANGTTQPATVNISAGDNVSGFVGILNNELRTVNYTVSLWLVNQTTSYDETRQENITTIHNLWYQDVMKTRLNHTDDDVAWEHNYSVTVNQTGRYRLMFLLFTAPTEGYLVGGDYATRASLIFAAAKIQQSFWVNVI